MVYCKIGLEKKFAKWGDLQIFQERIYELSGEGHRFFDLVRTERATDEIDGFVTGKHELFPIPQLEIDLAGGNWQQNNQY